MITQPQDRASHMFVTAYYEKLLYPHILACAYSLVSCPRLSKQSSLSGAHCPISYTRTTHWPVPGTGRLWRFVLTSTEPRDEAADPMRRSIDGAGSPSILFDHSGGRFCTLWRAATVCQKLRLHHCSRNAVPVRWTSASRGRLRKPGPTSFVSLDDRSPASYTHSLSQTARRMPF